jgi:hypothetical protein
MTRRKVLRSLFPALTWYGLESQPKSQSFDLSEKTWLSSSFRVPFPGKPTCAWLTANSVVPWYSPRVSGKGTGVAVLVVVLCGLAALTGRRRDLWMTTE